MTATVNASPRRLFFGILPPPEVRERLAALNRQLGSLGRPVPEANLHVTLHFLGRCTALDCLLEAASQIEAPAFTMTLDGLGRFASAQVVWAGCSSVPLALMQLAEACRAAGLACEVAGSGGAFQPHCTLRRGATGVPPALEFEPIVWPVQSFHLLESAGGYNSRGEFPLRSVAPGSAPCP